MRIFKTTRPALILYRPNLEQGHVSGLVPNLAQDLELDERRGEREGDYRGIQGVKFLIFASAIIILLCK